MAYGLDATAAAQPVRAGLLGVGYWGTRLVLAAAGVPEIKITIRSRSIPLISARRGLSARALIAFPISKCYIRLP
jgi:predicted homoserine dehydrogenase-like protein